MTKKLPKLKDQMQALISQASVSSLDSNWDMSNRPVVDQLAQWFGDLGFEIEIQPLEQSGKFNLIASYGKGPGGLVLSGHTDTVPFDEQLWSSGPLELTEKDNKWYGLGTADMKGFFAVVLQALEEIDLNKLQHPLIILATADEESSMAGARALVEAGYPKARRAIIGEPTDLKPIFMHKGFYANEIEFVGQSGHSSNPALGHNALDAMHQALGVLKDFRQELANTYQQPAFEVAVPTLNLGCIHGGDNPNRICGKCALQFDFRTLPGMPVEALTEQLMERIQEVADEHSQSFKLKKLYPGVPAFEGQKEGDLVKLAEKLTGHSAEAVAFATEAPFLSQLGMETIVLGAGSIDQAHQPDEFLPLDAIPKMVEVIKSSIKTYCM